MLRVTRRRFGTRLLVGDLLQAIIESRAYLIAAVFVGLYPVVLATWWVGAGAIRALHRERTTDESFYAIDEQPGVTVLLAAYNEVDHLEQTIASVEAIDWPDLEIVVVDDGSDDGSDAVLQAMATAGRIRWVRKTTREGKAMALCDALPVVSNELLLCIDADARPAPDVLRWVVPHFVRVPRVGAVALNPRVVNTGGVLGILQAIEFAATISTMRRAQATWGRLTTFSGIGIALRRSAVEAVGRWDPSMATEDIALAWSLQRSFIDVRYEPRALVDMHVPDSTTALWRQRTRWARGLVEVIKRDAKALLAWRERRMWPVLAEAVSSIVWVHLYALVVLLWLASFVVDGQTRGVSPIPAFWGLILITVAIAQIVLGIALDHRHDGRARVLIAFVPWFPLLYWSFNAAVAVRVTLPALIRARPEVVIWERTGPRVQTGPAEHADRE